MPNDIQFQPPAIGSPDLLIIAGEHSGDQHAARVVETIKKQNPERSIFALGGPALEAAGAQVLFDLTASSVVGIFEVLKNYNFFKTLFEKTVSWIREHRPKAICFVDYPGFNLRLAERLYREGLSVKGGGDIKLLYYIGPQIWAWKAKRRFRMAEVLDSLGVIFPFEVDCYQDTELSVEFVGHPFLDPSYQVPLQYDSSAPILLLPGSRKTPVGRIFPLMLKGFAEYLGQDPEETAIVIYPSESIREQLERILANFPQLKAKVKLVDQEQTVAAKAVLTSSGTMSLNCALASIPGAIVYRANPFTYLIGRQLVKIAYLGIANIILDKSVYPEYLQGAAHAKALSQELSECINSEERLRNTKRDIDEIKKLLSAPSERSPADWIAQVWN